MYNLKYRLIKFLADFNYKLFLLFFFFTLTIPTYSDYNEQLPFNKLKVAIPKNFYLLYEYHDDRAYGFGPELLSELIKGYDISVEYIVKDTWAEVINAVTTGEADLIPSVIYLESRKKYFDYTLPVMSIDISLVFKSDLHVKSVNDLNGKRLGVVSGQELERLLPDTLSFHSVSYSVPHNMLSDLLTENIDMGIFTREVFEKISYNMGLSDKFRYMNIATREIAIAVNKNKPEILNFMGGRLVSYHNSGELKKLYDKWFGKPSSSFFFSSSLFFILAIALTLIIVVIIIPWHRYTVKKVESRLDHTEKALFKNQEINRLLGFLVNSSNDAIISMDLNGIITSWNKGAKMLYGYRSIEMEGKKLDIIIPEELREEYNEMLKDAIKQENSIKIETERVNKDGKKHNVSLSLTPIRDKRAKVIGISDISFDITDLKNAIIEEKKTLLFMESVVDNLDAHIAILDKTGRIISVNESWKKFGKANDLRCSNNCIGMNYLKNCNYDVAFGIRKVISGNYSKFYYEYDCHAPDEKRWYAMRVTSFSIVDERFTVISHEDITKRKLAEENLVKAHEKLEIKVKDRTKELERINILLKEEVENSKKILEELEVAKKSAEEASQAKSQFLANMSHEIRTPMNAILGFASLLKAKEEDKKQKQYLDTIISGGKNLMRLIDDILDLSKIEAGKLELEVVSVDLHQIAKEMENIFSYRVREKQISFRTYIDNKIPKKIISDETRLRQIFLNLIGNAVKFTEEGYVSFSMNVKEVYNNTAVDIEIVVEDTGIGIAKEQQNIIFEEFMQQDGQSNRKYQGTGLGLTITKRLVEMLGGKLTVESKLGKGSRFIINLSRQIVSIDDDDFDDKDDINIEDYVFENQTILVVDDVAVNRDYIKEILAPTTLEVLEADNGYNCLDILETTKPDLIIMDIKMPGISGYETTRRIRRLKGFDKVPVITISASAVSSTDSDKDNSLFDEFLLKPIRPNKFIKVLTKYLKHEIRERKGTTYELSLALPDSFSDISDKLIYLLETDILDLWKKAKDTKLMDDIENFASEIVKIGDKYEIKNLTDYGNIIINNLEIFELDIVEEELLRYPEILDRLKRIAKEGV